MIFKLIPKNTMQKSSIIFYYIFMLLEKLIAFCNRNFIDKDVLFYSTFT
jgi:hypothetical protein